MSTNTIEAQELLRLYKCVVETGTGVLTAFAQHKLLSTYNGNFKQFLDDKKHELFHLWQSKKLSCCECPPAGYNFKRMSHMDNWIINKLYADNGHENRSHIRRNGIDIVQVCLHKYVTQNIAIHELDISAISFLLRNLIKLLANETSSLDIITNTRNKIFHAYSSNCYPMTLLNTMWNELENALVDLTDPSYKWSTRQQIKYLRKVILEKEEITELLSNVDEVLQAVTASSNNNLRRLIDMETRMENKAVNHTDDIKQHTSEEISYYASQAQEALSEKIQNTEENLQKEMKELKKSQDDSCQKLETQLHGTRSEINDTNAMVMEMSKTIKNLQLSVKCERPASLFVPEGACADTTEFSAIWHIKAPEDWDLKAIEATMKDQPNKDEPFKVKVVRKGSLIMLTTVAASILSDSEAFENAIFSFLTKMIEDCNINTEMPGRVDVTLHILNANEVSFSCELPPEVRHKQGTVLKKQGSALVKHDIAFLNADNENEIKWVQRAAFLMEDKLGIKCAIPGKDYLCGVPLKKLDVYFQKFRTVIVTLTKDSYIASKYKINKFESSVVVELDYRKKFLVDLRNMQYINGTLCEHLWFSQMAKLILKRHPDIGRRITKQLINEAPVPDCKSCITAASTAVYHKLTLGQNQQTQSFQALFCGCLITEPFIIEVCNHLAKSEDCVFIKRWEKSTACIYKGRDECMVFVFVSKYLKKCELLEEFISKHRRTAKRKLYSTKIEKTKSPSYIESFTTDIGTLSIDPAEIAALIQTILKDHEPSKYLTEAGMKKPSYPSRKVENVLESWEGPGATVLSFSNNPNIGTDDQHNSPMKKKKKEKKRRDPHSKEKEVKRIYVDPFTKEYPDKKEYSEGYENPWSKDVPSFGRSVTLGGSGRILKEYPDKKAYTVTYEKDLYPKEKELTQHNKNKLLERTEYQYPDKKEYSEGYENPWSKDVPSFGQSVTLGGGGRILKEYPDEKAYTVTYEKDLYPKEKELTQHKKNKLLECTDYQWEPTDC